MASPFPVVAVDVDGSIFIMMMIDGQTRQFATVTSEFTSVRSRRIIVN